jgi:hypothetical protein
MTKAEREVLENRDLLGEVSSRARASAATTRGARPDDVTSTGLDGPGLEPKTEHYPQGAR